MGPWFRPVALAGAVTAVLGLVGVFLLLVAPSSHHLDSHEPSPCHPVVSWLFQPDDPRFENERANSRTREQCAHVRQGRTTAGLFLAVPTAAAGAFGVYGLLRRR
ncbi:hypothetical protein GCM10007079_43420 [Nocardiopsis terrae]|nr:hypothetical protein GCM10007079_43420 [Nocardiopsis terrae]